MLNLTTENFESEVIRSEAPVFVVFTTPWCGFCHSMERNIDLVCHQLPDVKFATVDMDKQRELSTKYSVRSVPTSIVFKDGKLTDRKTGLLSKSEIFDLLSKSSKEKVTTG